MLSPAAASQHFSSGECSGQVVEGYTQAFTPGSAIVAARYDAELMGNPKLFQLTCEGPGARQEVAVAFACREYEIEATSGSAGYESGRTVGSEVDTVRAKDAGTGDAIIGACEAAQAECRTEELRVVEGNVEGPESTSDEIADFYFQHHYDLVAAEPVAVP